MAYCYECGSQVAEIDAFCPYCGISLKPVAVENSGDVSMEKTIVMTNGESSKLSENAVSADNPNTETATAPETQSEPVKAVEDTTDTQKQFGKSTSDFLSSKTEENLDIKADSTETPASESEVISSEPLTINAENEVLEEREVIENRIQAEEPSAEPASQEFTLEPGEQTIEEPQAIETQAVEEPQIIESETKEEPQAVEAKEENESDEDLPEPKHIEILKPVEEAADVKPVSIVEEAASDEDTFGDSTFDIPEPEISEPVLQDEAVSASASEEVEEPREAAVSETENAESVSDISADVDFPSEENKEFVETSGESAESSPPEAEEFKDFLNQDHIATMIHPSRELQPLIPNETVEESPMASGDENGEPVQDEPAILKPEEELAESQTPPSDAVFDSVQIVQSEKPEADFEEKVAAVEAENKQSGEVSEISESKDGRSFTAPNIGAENTDGRKAAKLKPLDEGTILNNRYEIVRKIGGGGMGAVYLASDKNLGGVLRAVKEMVQSYIEEVQQDKAISDFKRESMLLTSLEHAAIPTIYDYFFDEKEARFYLVMKYISGGDLAGRLRAAPEGKINEITVTEWGIQIADVLDYLHNRQPPIVYRDLKPANIMVDGNSGRLMLIDFGIARWINKEEKGVTAVGTMGYAPPELFSGNVEPRSDIYSLGSTMFHLLTGADPQSNPLLIFDFQKNPRPRQINSQLSDQMERILMQTVEYSAEKRFISAAELKKTLEEHLDNLKVGRVTFGVTETPASVTLSEQLVFCGFCGQKIVASDMFCAFCGAKQPLAQPGVHASPYVGQTAKAKLTLVNTEELEAPTFSLEKESNVVGRRDPLSNIFPEVDLSKFDPQTKISRRHARIWREGDNFMVEDLGSSNGTILHPAMSDSVRLLPHQPHVLTNGDKIKVGDTTMSFIYG